MGYAQFVKRLYLDYPVPREVSVWGGDGVNTKPLADLADLLELCVDDLAGDVPMPDYIRSTGMATRMPNDCLMVTSAKLDMGMFPGNRLVRVQYDKATNVATVRYQPAMIAYNRRLRVDDLDELRGARAQYVRAYVLLKMATKELSILQAVNMHVDNGAIDLSLISGFRDEQQRKFDELRKDILIYTAQ